jgi:hypothetical protein
LEGGLNKAIQENLNKDMFEDRPAGGRTAMEKQAELVNILAEKKNTGSLNSPDAATVDALVKQILSTSNASKWTGQGYGSAEKNAADMARIMAGIGITDIKQFGKIPTYEKAITKKGYNGQIAQQDEEGNYFISVNSGFDQEGSPISSRQNIDPKDLQTIYGSYQNATDNPDDGVAFVPADKSKVVTKDGVPMVQTGENFGNKLTGQAVPNTYTSRQTGNFFGGTYEGKGNTGYGVQFDAKGNPIFYTQGASSSDMGQIAPFLTLASFIPGLQPFAMAANAAIAAKQGNPLGVITNLAGMGGLAGISGMADVAKAARFASALKSGDPLAMAFSGANLGGITNIGGIDLKDISKTIGGIKALQSGDPLAMMLYGIDAMSGSGGGGATPASGAQKDFFDAEKTRLTAAGYSKDQIKEYFGNLENLTEDLDFTPEPPPVDNAPPPSTRSLSDNTRAVEADDFLKSIGINTIDDPSDSGLSNDDILRMVNADDGMLITSNRDKTPAPSPIDDYFKPTPKKLENIEIVGNLDKTKEHVFDPTFGGTMPLPVADPNNIEIVGNKEPKYLPTDDDFPSTPITDAGNLTIVGDKEPKYLPTDDDFPSTPMPTTPGATSTPKAPTIPKAPTAPRSAAPAASSGMDLNGLLGLLSGQQQPAQPAPMQDPYAHIKLMEELFGPTINLTPAGGNTPQRK